MADILNNYNVGMIYADFSIAAGYFHFCFLLDLEKVTLK